MASSETLPPSPLHNLPAATNAASGGGPVVKLVTTTGAPLELEVVHLSLPAPVLTTTAATTTPDHTTTLAKSNEILLSAAAGTLAPLLADISGLRSPPAVTPTTVSAFFLLTGVAMVLASMSTARPWLAGWFKTLAVIVTVFGLGLCAVASLPAVLGWAAAAVLSVPAFMLLLKNLIHRLPRLPPPTALILRFVNLIQVQLLSATAAGGQWCGGSTTAEMDLESGGPDRKEEPNHMHKPVSVAASTPVERGDTGVLIVAFRWKATNSTPQVY